MRYLIGVVERTVSNKRRQVLGLMLALFDISSRAMGES